MEKEKISFDKKNCTLVIDSIELCSAEEISKWVNFYISDVLDSGISRSYLTGKLEVTVMVVCHDYLVALYRISDNSPDEFIIQSAGYDKALRQSEAAEEQAEPAEQSEVAEEQLEDEVIDKYIKMTNGSIERFKFLKFFVDYQSRSHNDFVHSLTNTLSTYYKIQDKLINSIFDVASSKFVSWIKSHLDLFLKTNFDGSVDKSVYDFDFDKCVFYNGAFRQYFDGFCNSFDIVIAYNVSFFCLSFMYSGDVRIGYNSRPKFSISYDDLCDLGVIINSHLYFELFGSVASDSEAPAEQSVPVEYSEPSETSNQNEEIRCSYDVDGNLCFELGDELPF